MHLTCPLDQAEKTETAYWTADYRPKVKEELKKADKVCRNEKCGECEGYCEKVSSEQPFFVSCLAPHRMPASLDSNASLLLICTHESRRIGLRVQG